MTKQQQQSEPRAFPRAGGVAGVLDRRLGDWPPSYPAVSWAFLFRRLSVACLICVIFLFLKDSGKSCLNSFEIKCCDNSNSLTTFQLLRGLQRYSQYRETEMVISVVFLVVNTEKKKTLINFAVKS